MNYTYTIYACFVGYIVQAVVNNFVPLLFLTFQSAYQIPLAKITLLVTVNFGIQLLVDFASALFIDRIGCRRSVVLAHICSGAGLLCLTVLPDVLPDAYIGLLLSVILYAVGGGLIEVLLSPIVEGCPTENKKGTMSLLHSFYCWGHVGVVLISTLFFALFGVGSWKYLAMIWALIPAANMLLFSKAPLSLPGETAEKPVRLCALMQNRSFWVMLILMMSAGACEQSVSQWASSLAEQGLGVSKTVGDLAGPMLFAACMGFSRALYGKFGENINLEHFMIFSGLLCIVGYLLVALAGIPFLGFIGCGICGMAVGILWPGTFSIAAETIPGGATAMFAFLALAGDIGCAAGPTLVGMVSGFFHDSLRIGMLFALVFPVMLVSGLFMWRRRQTK